MRPPPRKRTKVDRSLKPESACQRSSKKVFKLQRTEQRKLLKELKRLNRSTGGSKEIDYPFLRKSLLNRSISEIHSAVEHLKDKVISCVSSELKKMRWEEKRFRKPIEVWTQMASAVAGSLEDTISSAFSQMLVVSSTEPRTLRNCDPPWIHRPPTDRPAVPLRSLIVEHPSFNSAHLTQVVKTPTVTMDQGIRVPKSKIPPFQQQRSVSARTLPASPSTSQSPAAYCQLAAEKAVCAPFISPQSVLLPVTPAAEKIKPSSVAAEGVKAPNFGDSLNQTSKRPSENCSIAALSPSPVATTTPSSVASTSGHSMPFHSTSATAAHARSGSVSKHATKDGLGMFGANGIVNFARIYHYISVIHKPNEECPLTPMESALVLDLLMSLPEELPLLDCTKLHKHLIQVHQCLSSPADSKIARETFKNIKLGLGSQIEAPSIRGSNRTTSQQNITDRSDVTDSRGKTLQGDVAVSQISVNKNVPNPLGDTDVMELPLLNPFMVPLTLLMRR